MVPAITPNDGTTIPRVGFGTFTGAPGYDATGAQTAKMAEIVGTAIEVGYRLLDTAQMYGNERGVGRGIAMSGISRKDVYVTSKLGNGNHRRDDVLRSFDETLNRLQLDQLDLFLVHWPLPTLYDGDYVST
jgi:2,5-diketo-D-gluconate reductase A